MTKQENIAKDYHQFLIDEWLTIHQDRVLLQADEGAIRRMLAPIENGAVKNNPTEPTIHGTIGSIRIVVVPSSRVLDIDRIRSEQPKLWSNLLEKFGKERESYIRWEPRMDAKEPDFEVAPTDVIIDDLTRTKTEKEADNDDGFEAALGEDNNIIWN